MTSERDQMDRIADEALDRALAGLAVAEAAAAPRPSAGLMARVLADAGAQAAAGAAVTQPGAMRASAAARPGPAVGARSRGGRDDPAGRRVPGPAMRSRAGWFGGGAGVAAALAGGLIFGFVTGLTGSEPELLTVAMSAEDEVIVVSDAGQALFGAESPF